MPHVRSWSTVESALRASDEGVRDADNAALHSVAIKTIRRWRRLYQRRGLPRGQVHTSVNSDDIRALCCWALDLVDIAWRQSNWKTISVSRREAVARLDALIGLKT